MELETAVNAVNINNGGGTVELVMTVASYFALFALIIVGFIFFRKYMLNRVGGVKSGPGAGMKIKDRLVIAQDKQIILLEVKNKIMLIGITPQSMTALCEFEKDETEEEIALTDENAEENEKKDGSFFGMLSEKMKTGFDSFDKNKKD